MNGADNKKERVVIFTVVLGISLALMSHSILIFVVFGFVLLPIFNLIFGFTKYADAFTIGGLLGFLAAAIIAVLLYGL